MIKSTHILIINSGSSSVKMSLLAMPSEQEIAYATVESVGEEHAQLRWQHQEQSKVMNLGMSNHHDAIEVILRILFLHIEKKTISAVGHRVVHGGEKFIAPTRLTPPSIEGIEQLSHLAPLHNPANILGMRASMKQLPDIPHIAVFDTAFHHQMPKEASLYAVPYDWYTKHGVRRYGFHGTSHHYVAEQAAIALQRPFEDCKLLTVHLGNGCSAAAIANGQSMDTTMGMTPLEGLVMGTRSGDVDPSLHAFMVQQTGMSLTEVTHLLNRQSGLLGLSGLSHDMRSLLEASQEGHERAKLAIDVFCYRLAKSLAGLAAVLGHLDAIIFTGGIGEHAHQIREKTVARLAIFGVSLDLERNKIDGHQSHGLISHDDAKISIWVIATNEEVMIARYVCATIQVSEKA
ncbi:MAG: acetate kinase [Mariprofundaceae bacterium]|nr:acetate kinase [Mariprofundaceae bacterium]